MGGLVGRTLHGTHGRPDAHGAEVVHQRLRNARQTLIDGTVPGLKAVGVASLGEELLGFLGIVRIGFQDQSPLDLPRDN
jgi:hypothetical protein